MRTEKIIYTVARESYAEQFEDRITAKLTYREWKEEYPETMLRKTIEVIYTLEFDDNSGCWLQ